MTILALGACQNDSPADGEPGFPRDVATETADEPDAGVRDIAGLPDVERADDASSSDAIDADATPNDAMPTDASQEDAVEDARPADALDARMDSDASEDATADAADFGPDTDACTDSDSDGVCDSDDTCPGADDTEDLDLDGAPDGCETRLPIEVMGPAGTRVSVRLNIEDASLATHLYLRCHSCGYRDRELDGNPSITKAGVRINGGELVPLKRYTGGGDIVGNPELTLLDPAEAYGGIGGGFHTVDMLLPLNGLVDGDNLLVFEHVDARPPSIGFRILDIDVLMGADLVDGLLDETHIFRDDPSRWVRPHASELDAVEGARLWHQPDLYDPAIDLIDGDGDGVGTASCSSCHATDGRDLQYFNYSNHSIVERSVYHGMTREEGDQIAAYIRSIEVELAPNARPWNPPYQPGAGLDGRPVHEWAAGAGLEAVLAEDSEMEAYLFPDGRDAESVAAVVDRFGTLNMRELPIALQLPDWNAWLPPLDPADAYDVAAEAIVADEDGVDVGQPFWLELYQTALADRTPETLGNLVTRLSRWLERDATCYSASLSNGPGWRAGDGVVSLSAVFGEARLDPDDCAGTRHDPLLTWGVELAKRSVISWAVVKQWEIMHGHELEREGALMTEPVCAGATCVSAAEARGWVTEGVSQGKNVFNRAPHYVGYRTDSFTFQDELVGTYESTA